MLAIKVVGTVDVDVPSTELHVSAYVQTSDARHLASAKTKPASQVRAIAP